MVSIVIFFSYNRVSIWYCQLDQQEGAVTDRRRRSIPRRHERELRRQHSRHPRKITSNG